MEILAVSYYNIGPFREIPLSVFFHQGKYLIDAPIGVGKSFLFFDGPLYGLYKYGERKLLNNLSDSGYIKVLFQISGEVYLVIRNLSPGKTKDSCNSEMYHVTGFDASILKIYDILSKNSDISDILQKNSTIVLEKISAKNEVDLSMSILSLLPPREVFVNTAFLMQDSGNIFELTPANRLLVLKNVFGLLGIDEIKDKITGIKRDIQTEKKVLSDFSEKDAKLKKLLTELNESIDFFQQNIIDFDYEKYRDILQDLDLLHDKVNIEKFSLDEHYLAFYLELKQYLDKYSTSYARLQSEYEQLQKKINQVISQKKEKQNTINIIEQTCEDLQQKIKKSDPHQIELLKQKKKLLYQNLEDLIDEKLRDKVLAFTHEHEDIFCDFSVHEDYSIVKETVQYLIDQGKIFKAEQDNYHAKIKILEEEYQHLQKELHEQDVAISGTKAELLYRQQKEQWLHVKEQVLVKIDFEMQKAQQDQKRIEEGNEKIATRIAELEKILEEKLPFYTEYLSPEIFDKEIKRSTYVDIQKEFHDLQKEREVYLESTGFSDVAQQISTLQDQKKIIEKDIASFQISPDNFLQDFLQEQNQKKQKLSDDLLSFDYENKKQKLDKYLQLLENKIQIIKYFLSEIDWKVVLDHYKLYISYQQDIKILDTQISEKESIIQTLKSYQDELLLKKSLLQQEQKSIEQLDQDFVQIDGECLEIKQSLQAEHYILLPKFLEKLRDMDNVLHALQSLITDHQALLIKLKKISQDEIYAKNLYTIFSKDLLLFVLEGNLPVLSDIINNFLSHVVDFSLEMKLVQKGSTLELETMIQDEKGKREIRSLSGGQKVVLKLVWMLSISVYLQSKMLFLDETINNLDPESIVKVSELIKNFVQQNAIKMYVITHSSEIKSMNIWDEHLQIDMFTDYQD